MTMFKSTINSTNFLNSSAPQSPNLAAKQKRINSAPSKRRVKPKKKLYINPLMTIAKTNQKNQVKE